MNTMNQCCDGGSAYIICSRLAAMIPQNIPILAFLLAFISIAMMNRNSPNTMPKKKHRINSPQVPSM